MTERNTVAQELATKEGNDWKSLSPEMVSAYLHNADVAIEERSRAPVDEVNPKPVYTCNRCQDKAYIDGKPCSECNPVGLSVEEVHPKIVVSISGGIPEGMEVGGSITTASEEAEAVGLEYQPLAAYVEKEEAEAEAKRLKEPKPHKHFYRKDGTCQCGQVKKVKKAK